MKHRVIAVLTAAGIVGMAPTAFAQPKEQPKPVAPAPAAPAPVKPAPEPAKSVDMAPAKPIQFSDAEMAQVAAALTGSWKCTNVPNAGSAGNAADVVMSVAPVTSKDMPDLLYAELARADALNRPYRQAIWQLHKVGGKLRLKTLEFRRARGEMLSAAGLWAAPEVFPTIGSEDLVTTLDIDLARAKDGKSWKGGTPHSYPTSMGGAVEMTSEVTISPDEFMTSDKGMDADGNVVWGPASPEGFVFKKFDPGVKVQRLDGGVVVIDFPAKVEGEVAKPGDKIVTHYSMYLANGWMFDSSYERGTPLAYVVGSRFVEGWRRAMADAKKGMQRKYVIPGPLGFGESGELRGKVPANATLYIDVQILDIVPGAAPAPMGLTPGAPGAAPMVPGAAGLQPIDPNSPEAQKIQEKIRKQQEAAAAKKAAEGVASPTAPKP
jgi:hypothetical protein